MASNEMPVQQPRPDRPPLTGRERRRRVLVLSALLALLAILAAVAAYWFTSGAVPVPRLDPEGEAIAPPEYLYSITGSGRNTLVKPVGVGVSEAGRVYVVDFGQRRISVFTDRGRYLFSFDEIDTGKLRNPVHLQIHNDEVWVTDRRLRAILVFGMDGTFKRRFEARNEPDLSWSPLAIAFDEAGQLRATDVGRSDSHRLMYFSTDGSRTASVGKTVQVTQPDLSPAGFYFPNGLAISSVGEVFVSDGDNRRVQVFDKNGEFKRFVDTSGVPRGIVIDEDGRLYVVDALAHTVDIYSLDGERLATFGERGYGPGQFSFPNDIAIGPDGRIFVTDRENDQVQVWGWPRLVVPERAQRSAPWVAALCLLPLLLLPLLLLRRRRTYVLVPDFVTALEQMGRLDALEAKRLRFVAPRADSASYVGRVLDGVDLERVVELIEHSPSDVAALVQKLRCEEREAVYLSLADRAHGLLTQDIALRRLGILAQVRVLDAEEFVAEVGRPAAR